MKGNVDLTEKGHFSEGWMQGGWMAKGVFRKRKPIKTSEKFKKILKMGSEVKEHKITSLAAKLFGLKLSNMLINNGISLTFDGHTSQLAWATTSTASTNSTWISTGTY